jgi:hypothetical protein
MLKGMNLRLRCNAVAPETAEHFDQGFTPDSGQLAHRLHFSVAVLALAGIPDLLSHPAMVCAKPVGKMKILIRITTVKDRSTERRPSRTATLRMKSDIAS